MRPVLESLSDGTAKTRQQIIDRVSADLNLSEKDCSELVGSGRSTVLYSRIHWALTYMRNAGLVAMPSRGLALITAEGQTVTSSGPQKIDVAFLDKYPGFRAFRLRSRGEVSPDSFSAAEIVSPEEKADPQERLKAAFAEIRQEVVEAVLERLRSTHYSFLEYVGVELLKRLGYGATGQVTGRSGDRGIDGLVNRDPLGLDNIYLQAKRYAETSTVGGREIREFLGAMHQRGATKGIFITTSSFTSEALEAAASTRGNVKLIDGLTLAGYLYDLGLGVVADGEALRVKRIDEGWYPDSEI